jgi:hypothetical protein
VVTSRTKRSSPQPAAGAYEFKGESSINRMGILPTGEVKIASLSFPYEVIAALVPDLATRINDFERLEAELRVKVIAKGDQLEIHGGDIVTAAGYPASRYVEVQGTAAAKVHAAASFGTLTHDGDRMIWRHTFDRPAVYPVLVRAVDTRGAGTLSRSNAAFNVTVKWPVSTSTTTNAFAGELFRKNLAVAGLEDRTKYRWSASLDGAVVKKGNSAMAEFPLPDNAAGKQLTLEAEYDGRSYPVAVDDESLIDARFTYEVLEAPTRIRNISFSRGGEYTVKQEFRFDAYVCGSCIAQNYRPADRVTVDAESENGRDLLDDYIIEPVLDADGRQIGTRVKFYLDGKVDRDGEEVLLTLRAGDAVERIPVIIFPD